MSPTDAAWQRLAETAPGEPEPPFDPTSLDGLPEPAARWLAHALPAGAPLRRVVELDMTGRIRLGARWMPFTATQILHVGVGFVWRATVGGRLLRFVGADQLDPDDARMEFRLHGLVPVARASGPDTARSAAGRLAAETVAWAPAGATPQLGATWEPGDDRRATVTVPTPQGAIDVTVCVDDDGKLTEVTLQRWNDSATPPASQPFGAEIAGEVPTADGIHIAGAGVVGWEHGTPGWPEGRFFEFSIGAVR